ncbi:pentapeptide repeat-containing protein [Thalassotalea fonticola]|uniref:Pentapeptide repeat-containing protein n=1 Tax=Thalassotalea fonticola TaxID=3065649 RepID=A0ABZ0GTI8_9GAMM|nr:pentapeptide repeat-containing protein [Colwelliaceae bacterium S1-1]
MADSHHVHLCRYSDEEGYTCEQECNDSGWCYWHDSNIIKDSPADKENLQEYARNGGMLRGISLKHADLAGIDLVNHHHKNGFDFSHADFYRADLTCAHLFNINLEYASLMKADLSEANLHNANIKHCNLLGIKWQNAKIKNIEIGNELIQEILAQKAQDDYDLVLALDLFEQSEEIYRDLRKHAEREGIFKLSGRFIQKELTMRRYQMKKPSFARLMSKVVDLFCGYGEEPLKVVNFSIVLILFCAILYFFTGINFEGQQHYFDASLPFTTNLNHFFSCMYYSVVTFTTLGYGDITPIGISRLIAATEAFTGSFTIALFVVVFVKKMTR